MSFIQISPLMLTANVGGVFLVLGFGLLFALIVAIIEFLWNVKKVAVEEKVRDDIRVMFLKLF